MQTLKKAYPLVCAKLEDLKSSVNHKIEELITSQQKLDVSKKDISNQVDGIKKRISDTFKELKDHIDRKEQEMLREADEFEEHNTKQVDHLLRLANGRAMNLSEHTQTIKEVLNQYGHQAACDFYAKNYQQIKESNTSDLPQLDQLASQTQAKVQISSKNIQEIIEGLQNVKLEIGDLKLQLNSSYSAPKEVRRNTAIFEERGKMTVSQGPSSVFDLGYKQGNLKSSVAKTMNKLKQNLVVSDDNYYNQENFKQNTSYQYENQPKRGPAKVQNPPQEYYNDYDEDEEDYRFMHR